jgi:hypothetical protein
MGSSPGRTTIVVTGHTAPFEGFLDRVDNEQIAGWVWNNNHPNSPVRVDLYNGNTLLATVPADLFREDLFKAHKGSGAHGFALSNPVNSKSGQLHTIRAFVSGTNFELAGSPKTFTASR